MVNKALRDMVVQNHGQTKWDEIRKKAGVENDLFISNEAYPDSLTYELVGAACDVMQIPGEELMHEFGVFWVIHTAREEYGELLDAGGSNLGGFLRNLPNFHSRVNLIFPNLEPPRFVCSDATPTNLRLHYYSDRPGLAPFVLGLVDGLGEMFNTRVEVRHEVSRGPESDHDVFYVSWEHGD